MFKTCVFREGSALPNIHKSLELTQDIPVFTEFEKIMFAKAQRAAAGCGAPYGVFVDPRTGLHMGASLAEEGQTMDKFTQFFPMPLLDALSAESQQERRRMAEAALSAEERTMMKEEGYVIRYTVDEEPSEDGWGRQSTARFQQRRLTEVRQAQRSVSYAIPPDVFQRICREIGQDFKSELLYTAEAIECMQTLTEAYVVGLAGESQLNALHGNRVQVRARDFQLAQHMRGAGDGRLFGL
jgi:histone H3